MSDRTINICAGIASFLLLASFVYYEINGQPFGVTFAFLPVLTFAVTFLILAIQQTIVAYDEQRRPLRIPVPFRWVMAAHYASFALLLWWLIAQYFIEALDQQELRRVMWLQAGLVFIWFLRRFLIWDRPPKEEPPPQLNGNGGTP